MNLQIIQQLKAPFPLEQVSWRAQSVTKDGTKAMALAYLDARDVMERLDNVVGPFNWQNRYTHAEGKTVCEIGIQTTGEWIWKADGAGDSDVEAEKGALSDAFKRAAVRWGIGRYLYDFGTTWVPCESYQRGDKHVFSKFTDDPWKYVKRQTLNMATPKDPVKVDFAPVQGSMIFATDEQLMTLHEWIQTLEIPLTTQQKWLHAGNVSSFKDMDADKVQKIIESLKQKAA